MQATTLGSIPQPNMVAPGMSPQSAAGYVQHPNYSGVQSFGGQPMVYSNSQWVTHQIGSVKELDSFSVTIISSQPNSMIKLLSVPFE